jgi:hypothetical protein
MSAVRALKPTSYGQSVDRLYPFLIVAGGGGPDTTPDAFSFTDQTNVALSTVITSASITVSGIDTATDISVTGGQYSINGGVFTSSPGIGAVVNGDQIQARNTSSGSYSTAVDTVVTIGGVSDTFTSTTLAADTTPDAFSFVDQTNVAISSTITSAAITVSGINSPATITVSGGTYNINGGSFTASSGSVSNGDTVQARNTSSGSYSTAVNTVVTIGGVSDTFTSTTTNGYPVLVGQLPNISAAFNSSTHQYDLGFYFSGATSYAISPAIEPGWSFNTSSGLLTIDTDDANTFGPYTVTATNANGSTPGNAFTVKVSDAHGGGGFIFDFGFRL